MKFHLEIKVKCVKIGKMIIFAQQFAVINSTFWNLYRSLFSEESLNGFLKSVVKIQGTRTEICPWPMLF